MLVGTDTLEARIERRDVELAAQALGQQLIIAPVSSEGEFDGAFTSIVGRGAKALLVGTGPLLTSNRERVVALAARHAIPAIYAVREFVVAGGLMSYGASIAEAYRQAGIYAGRILKGEKPADLPVMQSTKFELVDQPQDREDARSHSSAGAARDRRRGDRIRALFCCIAYVASWPYSDLPRYPLSKLSGKKRTLKVGPITPSRRRFHRR